MKIGVMLNGSLRKDTFEERLEEAAKLNIDGVQLCMKTGLSDEKAKEYLKRVEDKGLEISSVCGDIGGYANAAENEAKVKQFKEILDLSVKLGCNIVTSHIGRLPEEDPETYQTIFKACKSIADYAASIGAVFAIETGPEKAVILKRFLDEIDSKGIGVNLDPANLVMCSCDDAAAACGVFGDYIVHTHAKDGINTGGRTYLEVPLGQGGVHYDTYLPALHAAGYDGFLAIERECGDDPLKDIGMAVDFLRDMTKRYGFC